MNAPRLEIRAIACSALLLLIGIATAAIVLPAMPRPAPVAAQESTVLTAENPIALAKVEGRMDHLSVDVKGQRLFVTAFTNHTLEVLDLKTRRQVHTIPDLDEPQGAFYDPETNRLFVACGGDGTVKIFDGNTYRLLQTVK